MRVLVIAAHPDDELLGLGGTLARHVTDGDDVIAIIVSEGATSRYESGADLTLVRAAEQAAKILGLREVRFLGQPDQRLDAVPAIELVQAFEPHLRETRPEIVYTHHWGDVNLDHRVVCDMTMTATRPVGEHYVRSVYAYETPSATEWGKPDAASAFVPTRFVDITKTIETKLAAMACYETELRPAPHPRSLEALRSRAQYWGQIVSVAYAEPFVVVREVI